MNKKVSGVRFQVSANGRYGAEGMESFEFGSGNAEVGKAKTKYETLYTKHRFDLQSAIRNRIPDT